MHGHPHEASSSKTFVHLFARWSDNVVLNLKIYLTLVSRLTTKRFCLSAVTVYCIKEAPNFSGSVLRLPVRMILSKQ